MADANPSAAAPSVTRCGRCQAALTDSERVPAQDRFFCRTCYEILKLQLRTAAAGMKENVNYPMAALGAVLGGAAGVLAWWGFTVLTGIGFGLVAVAIGFLVGHGAARGAGGKRSMGLQVLAVVIGAVSFLVAAYLVNMTFINQALTEQGRPFRVPFPPTSPVMFYNVLAVNFGIMKLVFLAIVAYEAWIIPRPVRLAPPA